MKTIILPVLIGFCLVAVDSAVGQSETDTQDANTIAEHELEEFGVTLLYAGDKKPKQFLTETPCVVGTSWQFTSETDEYYVGTLSYPTENTVDYRDRNSQQYFVVNRLRIRKQEGLPIDLSTNQVAIVLRDPSPGKPLSSQGDDTLYELVGFATDPADTAAKYTLLFKHTPELRFRQADDDE